MNKMEGSSIDLRAKHRYRFAVQDEATCATCAHRWRGGVCSYCEVLSGAHDIGTMVDEHHTCDLHEER
jgi:hypothetical protein